jgi:hypothetical protein
MMALEPVGAGLGATAHLRTANPAAVAEAIADWATRPLRVQLPKPISSSELQSRIRARIKSAIADAAVPPPLHTDGLLPEVEPGLSAFYYPRDRRGRMLTTVKVLIELVETGRPGRRSRCRFLRFRGSLEVLTSDEFVENQEHRWHQQPWRWRAATGAPAAERWGVQDVEAAVAATELLEAGQQERALAAFGVKVGPQLAKVLAGEPLGPSNSDLAARWGTVAAEELAGLAPWRLTALAGKTWVRLFGLGGINAQVKPVVALGVRDGSPTLEVTALGSNRRLAREDWERPLDFEAQRLGIVVPSPLAVSAE